MAVDAGTGGCLAGGAGGVAAEGGQGHCVFCIPPGRRCLVESERHRIIAQLIEMTGIERTAWHFVAFVALDLPHEDAGKVQEVGADPAVLTRSITVGADALLVPPRGVVVAGRVGRKDAGYPVAVDTSVVGVDRRAGPGSARGAAVAGDVAALPRSAYRAGLRALVRGV